MGHHKRCHFPKAGRLDLDDGQLRFGAMLSGRSSDLLGWLLFAHHGDVVWRLGLDGVEVVGLTVSFGLISSRY
jgi:hypothetical protein